MSLMFCSELVDIAQALESIRNAELLDAGKQLLSAFGITVENSQYVLPCDLRDFTGLSYVRPLIDRFRIHESDLSHNYYDFAWLTCINVASEALHNGIAVLGFDLRGTSQQRSYAALNFHETISKIFNRRLIVLSLSDNGFCFTISSPFDQTKSRIILSDWYTYDVEGSLELEAVDPLSFSLDSSSTYYYDFATSFARDYIFQAQPIWQIATQIFESTLREYIGKDIDMAQVRILRQDARLAAQRYYIDLYGDDYVDYSEKSDLNDIDDIWEDSDIDFDLLEDELLGIVSISEAEVDETSGEEVGDLEDEAEDIALEENYYKALRTYEVPKAILNDPVLLLKWLDVNRPS